MAGSAVPPTRLAERTRAAVREVLLAELRSADRRALAAGCSRETLFEVLDARLSSLADEVTANPRPVAEDGCGQPIPAAADQSPAARGCLDPIFSGAIGHRSAANCGRPDSITVAAVGDRPATPAPPASDGGCPASVFGGAIGDRPASPTTAHRPVHPSSASEDREHRRDDPLQPGLVGEGGG